MKTSFKRAAAWLLTVLMILSCVPALATGDVTDLMNGVVDLSNAVSTYAVDDGDKIQKKAYYTSWTVPVYFYESGTTEVVDSLTLTVSNGSTVIFEDDETITNALSSLGDFESAKLATSVSSNDGTSVDGLSATNSGYTYYLYADDSLIASGWYINSVGTDYAIYIAYVPSTGLKVVTFNANGGSGTVPESITCEPGATIMLPSGESLTREGYTFMGWGTTANSGGAGDNMKLPIYPAGDSYDVTESITLYAIWGQNSQPAWFYVRLDGQIPNEPNTDTATKAAKYTGTGDDPGDGMKVNNALKYAAFYFNSSGVDSHLNNYPAIENIYAAVEAKSSSIYFGDGSKYQHCTLEEFEQNYYVLWYVIKNPGDNHNVYHVDGVLMKKSLYTVTYDINAPIGSYVGTVPNGTQYREGATVNITSESFTRTGYTFGGWATTEVNGEYKVYNGGDTFQMPANNVKLTAIWIPNSATPYKVEYYYSTGEDESGNPIYADPCYSSVSRTGTTGAHVEVTEADKVPEKNGYVLDDGAEERLYEGTIAADGSLVLKVYFKYTGGDKKTIGVQKEWVGPETDSVTIRLTRNGSPSTADTLTLNATNGWYDTFSNLPTYDRNGIEISYGVEEEAVTGYETTYSDPVLDQSGVPVYTVTNSYIPQKISISVTKVWDDSSNVTGARPASLEVKLIGKVAGEDIKADENGEMISSETSYETVVEAPATLSAEYADNSTISAGQWERMHHLLALRFPNRPM